MCLLVPCHAMTCLHSHRSHSHTKTNRSFRPGRQRRAVSSHSPFASFAWRMCEHSHVQQRHARRTARDGSDGVCSVISLRLHVFLLLNMASCFVCWESQWLSINTLRGY